jgi:hypothetical protein
MHPVLSITIEPFFAVSTENKILYLLRRRIDRLRRESDRLILPVPEECIERARQEMTVAEFSPQCEAQLTGSSLHQRSFVAASKARAAAHRARPISVSKATSSLDGAVNTDFEFLRSSLNPGLVANDTSPDTKASRVAAGRWWAIPYVYLDGILAGASWGGEIKKRLGAGNLPVSPFLEVAPMIPSILQKVLRDRHLRLGAASSIPGLIYTLIDPCSHWAFTRNDHPE